MIDIAKPLIGKEEIEAVRKVLESGMIACGPKTAEFEKRFADFVGTSFAIATNSGTTALHLALLCLRIGKGDEVIVPSFSFIASANVPLFCNAKSVFCDIDSNPISQAIHPACFESFTSSLSFAKLSTLPLQKNFFPSFFISSKSCFAYSVSMVNELS